MSASTRSSLGEVNVSFDDLNHERQLDLAVPRRFTPERAEPVTAGELIQDDAEDRERARREISRREAEFGGGE